MGKDENCFAQEKLILVVKSKQQKIRYGVSFHSLKSVPFHSPGVSFYLLLCFRNFDTLLC